MTLGFQTELVIRAKAGSDSVWILDEPLIYYSKTAGRIEVPPGFETDLASTPRVPVIYGLWGDRVHREAVLHDYNYRSDSIPIVSRDQADDVFLEAMESRGVTWWIRYPMYLGVRCGGGGSYHQRLVGASL